jgi:hypothetical protein
VTELDQQVGIVESRCLLDPGYEVTTTQLDNKQLDNKLWCNAEELLQ